MDAFLARVSYAACVIDGEERGERVQHANWSLADPAGDELCHPVRLPGGMAASELMKRADMESS